ncbi:MAG: hypothetical protein V1645_01555 [archaeon]
MNIIGNVLLFIFEWFCRIAMAGFWLFMAGLYLVGLVISEVLLFFSGNDHIPNCKYCRRR